MLVEINLLPKKEPKNIAILVILISSLFIILVAGIVFFWQGTSYESKITSLNNQIKTTQKLVEVEQAKQASTSQSTESLAVLESAVQWANEEPLKSAPILKRVIALLPQRGFIQTISYAEVGTISLTVQFDTSRDAAYFYKTLLDSKWISEAKLSSLATNTTENKESSETDSNNTTNEEQYIPRYTGQYEIKLNRNVINQEERLTNTSAGGQGGNEL